MSYTSSLKLDKNEEIYNCVDTFKEDKERTSSSNVFNHNLGRSGVNYDYKNDSYSKQNYNIYAELDQNNDLYNNHNSDNEKDKAEYSLEQQNEIIIADNLEIYEDKNNHIEEFNEEANGDRREENENISD